MINMKKIHKFAAPFIIMVFALYPLQSSAGASVAKRAKQAVVVKNATPQQKKSIKAVKTVKSVKPVKTKVVKTKVVNSAKALKVAKVVKPIKAKVAKTVKPTKAKVAKSVKPIKAAKSTNVVKSVKPIKRAKSTKVSKSAKTIKTSKRVKAIITAKSVTPIKATVAIKAKKPAESIGPIKAVEKAVEVVLESVALKQEEAVLEKVNKNFNLASDYKGAHQKKEVQKYVKQYAQSKKSLITTTTNAKTHLHYIAEQIEKRKLPGELAFLPMIESNFQLHARSNKGAVGLWQFMPGTAKQYGLKLQGNDDRKDVKASTQAALTYLEYLHKKFNQDWMLALAAYNAGEGTVERAIKRNKKAGQPTHFWALKLPKETKAYVPKFLALTHIMGKSK